MTIGQCPDCDLPLTLARGRMPAVDWRFRALLAEIRLARVVISLAHAKETDKVLLALDPWQEALLRQLYGAPDLEAALERDPQALARIWQALGE